MGWDVRIVGKHDHILTEFAKHCKSIVKEYGEVDGLFSVGSLDCSLCGKMLEEATGKSVYVYEGWNKELIAKLYRDANWDFVVHPQERWAKVSARLFLALCYKYDLDVKFSW